MLSTLTAVFVVLNSDTALHELATQWVRCGGVVSVRAWRVWRTSAGDSSCSWGNSTGASRWLVLCRCWDNALSTCPCDLHSAAHTHTHTDKHLTLPPSLSLLREPSTVFWVYRCLWIYAYQCYASHAVCGLIQTTVFCYYNKLRLLSRECSDSP